MLKHFISLALLMTAACASDDQPSMTGTWRVVPNALVPDEPVVVGADAWTFHDDGTLVASRGSDSEDGYFEIDGDRIQISFQGDDEIAELDVGFVLASDRLLMGVLFPDGDIDGLVGAWSGTSWVNDQETHWSVVLDADGAATSELDGDARTGTWEEDGESIALRFDGYSESWFRIGERGIGDVLLERVE